MAVMAPVTSSQRSTPATRGRAALLGLSAAAVASVVAALAIGSVALPIGEVLGWLAGEEAPLVTAVLELRLPLVRCWGWPVPCCRRCCAIRSPIRMCWVCRAARRSLPWVRSRSGPRSL
jgi:hypothetical protein